LDKWRIIRIALKVLPFIIAIVFDIDCPAGG